MVVNHELKGMWKELVVTYFKVLSPNFLGEIVKP
jgi:hypothetical protein